MKKLTLLFIYCLAFGLSYAQDNWTDIEFFFGYHQNNMLNPTFAQNLGAKSFSHEIGYEMGLRMASPYLMADFHYGVSPYQISSSVGRLFSKEASVSFKGLGASLSLFLLPRISKHFSPYAGVGYVTGGISAEEKSSSSSSSSSSSQKSSTNVLSAVPIDGTIWKFGVRASIRRVSLSAEYRQSFGGDNKAFQQFHVGIAYKMFSDEY